MAFDNQPTLVECYAAGSNGATVPATTGAYFGVSNLGTADGMLFDVVTIGSGQTMTYDNTVVSGLTMRKTVTTTTNNCFGEWTSSGLLGLPAAQQWFRLWLYQTSNPSAAHEVAAMLVSGALSADVMINANGTMSMRDSGGTIRITTTNTVPLNTLFRVEGYITSSASAGQVELKLFTSAWAATPTETQTSGASLNTLGGALNQVRYGAATSAVAGLTWWDWCPSVSTSGYIGPGAVVQHMVCGAPAPAGFTVISKPVGGTSLRLKVATNSGMTANVTYVSAQTPDQYGYVSHTVTGLSPYTRYYCQLLDTPPGQSEMTVGPVGTIKTLITPGTIGSFTLGIASCITTPAGFAEPDAAINDWVTWQPDLSIFTGDFTYEDPLFTDTPDQLGCLEFYTWFYGNEPLVRQAWGYYCRSNHDTSSATTYYDDTDNTWTAQNLLATQEFFPNGTLGDTVNNPAHSLCESWVTGRVRFIKIDVRNTDRTTGTATDNSSKTMLGPAQLAWLQAQITGPEPLKVIITDTQWLGTSAPSLGADPELGKWWSYQTERAAIISQMIASWSQMRNVILIHGDFHGVAVATAAQSAANGGGGFPVYCAAPVRQTGAATHNPGTFTSYYNNAGGNCAQYGRVTFTDNGTTITVNFQGWDAINGIAQVQQTDVFNVAAGNTPARGLMGGL